MPQINWETYKTLKGVWSENNVYWKRGKTTYTTDGWPAYKFSHVDEHSRTTTVVLGCMELSRYIDMGKYKPDWNDTLTK